MMRAVARLNLTHLPLYIMPLWPKRFFLSLLWPPSEISRTGLVVSTTSRVEVAEALLPVPSLQVQVKVVLPTWPSLWASGMVVVGVSLPQASEQVGLKTVRALVVAPRTHSSASAFLPTLATGLVVSETVNLKVFSAQLLPPLTPNMPAESQETHLPVYELMLEFTNSGV